MAGIVLVEGNNELNVGLTPIPPPLADLSGVVTDSNTGIPLSGVLVTINGLAATTGVLGEYLLVGLTPGSYVIQFSKEGYETLVI